MDHRREVSPAQARKPSSPAKRLGAVTAACIFAVLGSAATPAFAQGKGTKPPKAAPKTAPKTEPKVEPKAEPPPEAQAPEAQAPDDSTTAADAAAAVKGDKAVAALEPPREEWDPTNVDEAPDKTYFFVGLRYRGNVIPKFMLNLFVDEGKTIYSNTIGAELDIRRGGFSLIPALVFTEYATGDILFKQKNKPDIPANYSVVNSSMKAIYATADLLWSTKISKNFDFEYGAGFGIGVLFGDLSNNWVQLDPNGPLGGENGQRYRACATVLPGGTGCNKVDHQNSDVDKVGGYTESNWFSGGSKPVIFPWLSVPQVGLRFKPVKQFAGRLGVGFALTGFWFGLSGEYGLEKKPTP